jgi:hypothetical protein
MRRQEGLLLRQNCSRRLHAEWKLSNRTHDPIEERIDDALTRYAKATGRPSTAGFSLT